jgi:hypothetical protein
MCALRKHSPRWKAEREQAKASPCTDIEMPRRFPPPWTAEETQGGYVVRDANKQALAYVYCRENENDAAIAKVLTKDKARRFARNIAKLPEALTPRLPVSYLKSFRLRRVLLAAQSAP